MRWRGTGRRATDYIFPSWEGSDACMMVPGNSRRFLVILRNGSWNNSKNYAYIPKRSGLAEIRTQDLRHVKATS